MKVNEEDIKQLISNIIADIDYDMWKEFFVYPEHEDEEVDRLVSIVESWLYAKGLTEDDYAPTEG